MDGHGMSEWRMRPVLLAGVGVVAAILCQRLLDTHSGSPVAVQPDAGRVAIAAAVATGALTFAVTAERVRLGWCVMFAGVSAAVAGSVAWWSGGPGRTELFDWQGVSLLLAIVTAAPLFQAARDAGRARFTYPEVHGHAWTDVVLWFAGCGFTGVVFALAWLLAALFELIGITLLSDVLGTDWVTAGLVGGALGAGLGLFREREAVVRTLQRVVTAVLGVLAPVLGGGLLLFLAALPFTGLGALWEATRATTPILLVCVGGALILANAVIGDGGEGDQNNPALRWGARALAAAMLPLGLIAAIATGLRIAQHGLTPERLWAVTFVAIACAFGLAYLVALVRGRRAWAVEARVANLRLAFAVAALALFLALPIVSFNAVSTRDQVARLTGGRVTPERFDWAALAFDFGAPGRSELTRLAGSSNAAIARFARDTRVKANRYDVTDFAPAARARETLDARLRILPAPVALPPALREALVSHDACGPADRELCTLLYTTGAMEAVAVPHECLTGLTPSKADPRAATALSMTLAGHDCRVAVLRLRDGRWTAMAGSDRAPRDAATVAAIKQGLGAGMLEVRPVARRQLFVGGQPVGDAFE